MKHYMHQYLATIPNQPIKTLQDIIDFNTRKGLPNNMDQNALIAAQATGGLCDPVYQKALQTNKDARKLIRSVLKANSIDALIAPSFPSLWSEYPSARAGFPILNIPAGVTEEGSPFGVSIYSDYGKEHVLFSLAHHLDANTTARQPPQFKDT